jgi:trehalose 6-phosphate synthase
MYAIIASTKNSKNSLSLNQRLVSIQHYPIGVDVPKIGPNASEQTKHSAMKTIIGVDRIDYSKAYSRGLIVLLTT